MRGTMVACARAFLTLGATSLVAGHAAACVINPAPPTLRGFPGEAERNAPTNLVPAFEYAAAQLDAERLALSVFVLVSASGETTALAPRATYASHFELFPERELRPFTSYAIHGTLPPQPDGAPSEVTFTFETGPGRLDDIPGPPTALIQDLDIEVDTPPLCGPPTDPTCLSFVAGSAIDLAYIDVLGAEDVHYLVFDSGFVSSSSCTALRVRGENGLSSDPVFHCPGDAKTYSLESMNGVQCTDRGVTVDGVPLDEGEPIDPGPAGSGDDGSRTYTDGCGCSIPGAKREAAGAWGMALALAVFSRRARRERRA